MIALILAVLLGVTLLSAAHASVWVARDLVLRILSVAAFLLVMGMALVEDRQKPVLAWDALDVLVGFGMIWTTLAAWNSDHSYRSFYACRGFLAFSLWWFVLRALWRRWPDLFAFFLAGFLGVGLVAAGWVITGTLANQMNPLARPFLSENFASAFFSILLLVSILRWFRLPGWPQAVPAVLFFMAWALMKSRGGFLAMGVALALFFIWNHAWFEERFRRWKVKQWLIFAGVILALFLTSFRMIDRVFTVGEKDPRAYDRVTVIWKASLEMAGVQPVMGFGPGVYQDLFPYYRPATRWYLENEFAHNEFLQAAVAGGWPLGAWALALAMCLGLSLRSRRGSGSPFEPVPIEGEVAAWTAPLLALGFVWAFLDFVLHEWCVSFPLLAILAFSFREPIDLGLSATVRFSRWVGLGAALVISAILMEGVVLGGLKDYLAEESYLRGLGAQRVGRFDEARDRFARSVQYRPRNPRALGALGVYEWTRAIRENDASLRGSGLRNAEEYFRKAITAAPHSVSAKSGLVEFWQGTRQYRKAMDLQKEMTAALPGYLPNYFRQGLISLDLSKPHEAISLADRAIERKGNYQPAYLLKGMAYEYLGRPMSAFRTYREGLNLRQEAGEIDVTAEILNRLGHLRVSAQSRP